MHLVVFSPPAPVQAEAELLNAMFEHGLARYHLRRPGMTWDQVWPVLDALKPEHRLKTMVHQHHSEATQDYGIMVRRYCYKRTMYISSDTPVPPAALCVHPVHAHSWAWLVGHGDLADADHTYNAASPL